MMKKDLMNPLKLLAMLFVVVGLIFTTSCEDDDDNGEDDEPEPTESLMEIVRNTAGLDSLEKYLENYPDLVGTLEGSGDFTVFAPNNAAFISLLATPGFPADISLINPDIIKGVLSYHVSATRFEAADLTGGLNISTVQGEAITVNNNGTLLTGSTNSEIEVVTADVQATNGVAHIVGSVLIPPSVGETLTPILGTNAGTLLLGASFSDLAAAIAKADEFAAGAGQPTLTSILSGTDVHTVFAPTNETFAAAGLTVDSFDGQTWYGIIANHVVLEEVTPDELVTGATFTTAAQGTLLFFNDTDVIPADNGLGIYIDGNGSVDLADPTTFTTFDAEVALPNAGDNDNGLVHVIAGVLSPQ